MVCVFCLVKDVWFVYFVTRYTISIFYRRVVRFLEGYKKYTRILGSTSFLMDHYCVGGRRCRGRAPLECGRGLQAVLVPARRHDPLDCRHLGLCLWPRVRHDHQGTHAVRLHAAGAYVQVLSPPVVAVFFQKHRRSHNNIRSTMSRWHAWSHPLLIGSMCLKCSPSRRTPQFFPIYFAEELGMSPIAVNVIFILDPIVEVILSLFGQRLSLKVGRVEVCICTYTHTAFCKRIDDCSYCNKLLTL